MTTFDLGPYLVSPSVNTHDQHKSWCQEEEQPQWAQRKEPAGRRRQRDESDTFTSLPVKRLLHALMCINRLLSMNAQCSLWPRVNWINNGFITDAAFRCAACSGLRFIIILSSLLSIFSIYSVADRCVLDVYFTDRGGLIVLIWLNWNVSWPRFPAKVFPPSIIHLNLRDTRDVVEVWVRRRINGFDITYKTGQLKWSESSLKLS